jgi:hypothetical protein
MKDFALEHPWMVFWLVVISLLVVAEVFDSISKIFRNK